MQDHPKTRDYVVVTYDEYTRYFDYCIVRGQLKKIDKAVLPTCQLKKSTTGTAVVLGHAALVLDSTETYSNTEYYDQRNS